ncbi:MAG: NUDIX domain-containing protein [Clostridiales bacterium]|nr:NUDIX domain-containing protein [Clostridiales bacterium]
MHFTYCPHCGEKLILKEVGDEGKIPYCEKCQAPFWDMFSTAVICAVVNELGEVALLRQDYVSKTSLVCVAGMMKIGETAEETAVREVAEELGLHVQGIRFIRTFYYPKKELLMIGFRINVKKADFHLSGEVDAAEWDKPEPALKKMQDGSIAQQLVTAAFRLS